MEEEAAGGMDGISSQVEEPLDLKWRKHLMEEEGKSSRVVLLDLTWRRLLRYLDRIIDHLMDAADTLVLVSETLDRVHELGLRYWSHIDAGPAGWTEARRLTRHIYRGIDLSCDLISELNAHPERVYTCDRFSPLYRRCGHLFESNGNLQSMINSKPCDKAILSFAKATDDDTLDAIDDAVQKITDSLLAAITKMKILNWYIAAFRHILSSEPTKNCYVAGSHACEAAKNAEAAMSILEDLRTFLENQPPLVRDSFGHSLPAYNRSDPGSTTKDVQMSNESVDFILGDEGYMLRLIRVHSGAKMHIQPGSEIGSVDLSGTPDQISRAERLIHYVLGEADAGILRPSPIIPSSLRSTTKLYEYQFPNAKIPLIIGDFEETLRHLHVQSGAQIHTCESNVQPGRPTIPVKISGTPEQIRRVERLMHVVFILASFGITRSFSLPGPTANFFQMQLENGKALFVIGEGGETLRSLQAQSGARIQVVPFPCAFSTERTLYIDGTAEEIEKAKLLISEVTSQHGPYEFSFDPLTWILKAQQPTD